MGRGIAVDPAGRAYGCAMLAGAASTLALEAESPLHAFEIGDVRAPEFAARLGSYANRLRRSGLFAARRDGHSIYGRCGDCRFIGVCSVCPASCAFEPSAKDPNAVSDFVCAFNRVMFTERERFPAEASAWDRLAGRTPVPTLVRELHDDATRRRRANARRAT